jgi:SAM-dependent methyltransferase
MPTKNDSHSSILGHVDRYYSEKIQAHGATPRGVDWNGEESQFIRFAQLYSVVEPGDQHCSINDLGCGYGAFLDYLELTDRDIGYVGYDISRDMIQAARERWQGRDTERPPRFVHGCDMQLADYTIASGIFNVKQDTPASQWLDYVLETLQAMDRASVKGFACNMLTQYSDPPFMRPHLWYADPGFIFDYCMRRFSRKVALLHDYQLYEFTLIVRKGERS